MILLLDIITCAASYSYDVLSNRGKWVMDIDTNITKQNLIRASHKVLSEGGLRPQWVALPENEDLVEKTNRKSREVIYVLKMGKI